MALSLRNQSSRGSVGLDVDGAFVSAVQASGGRIANAASEELPAELVRDGEVADVEGLSTALKDFFGSRGLPKRVYLGVGNQQIVVRHLDLPQISDDAQLDAAVRFQAAEAIAMPLDESALDYQVVGETTSPEGAPRVRVVVVAAREAMVERFVDAVRGAGLRPEGIDLNSFALVRALAPIDPGDGQQGTVYCHLGGVTNLAVALGRLCVFTRQLSTTWNDEGKHNAGALAEEIRLSIDFYMAQSGVSPVGEVLLSGPGAGDEEFVRELTSISHLPVSAAPPLGALDASGLPAGEDPYRHTVAAGLALGAAA